MSERVSLRVCLGLSGYLLKAFASKQRIAGLRKTSQMMLHREALVASLRVYNRREKEGETLRLQFSITTKRIIGNFPRSQIVAARFLISLD